MKFILKFSILLLIIIYLNLCKCVFDIKNDTDIDLHCRQFDFETKLNISVGTNITIVYNSSLCKKCIQKLLLFKALQNRFELASYNELTFIMLTMEHRDTEQFKELQNRAGNIILLSLHEISNEFFLPKSFYIFDKCGRLTYELTSPFSEIQNQIVKAAILSTWFDSPCGNCNTDAIDNPFYSDDNYITSDEIDDTPSQDIQNTNTIIDDKPLQIFPNIHTINNIDYHDENDSTEILPNDQSYIIPLKIIIPSEHMHLNNDTSEIYTKYNYFILNSNDSYYHEHFEKDNIENLTISDDNIQLNYNQTDDNNNQQKNINIKLTNDDNINFEIIKNYSILDENGNKIIEYQELKQSKIIKIITKPIEERSEKDLTDVKNNTSVYSALHPWISFRLRQLI